ncbi:MAG: S8 family serine peptidase [Bacteriovoracaceae bacterium]
MKWISFLLLLPSIAMALPVRPGAHFRVQIPGEYIVRSNSRALLANAEVIGPNLYLVKGEKLSFERNATEIYPNYAYYGNYMEFTPNDPSFASQFHHVMLQTPDAWSINSGSEDIIVAVTDNEFTVDHDDLKTAFYKNEKETPNNGVDDDNNGYIDDVRGWDVVGKDNNVDEEIAVHGTHVSGIIAATTNNGIGIAGIAPHVKVLPIRFYDQKKPWTSAVVSEAYYYAVKMGAKIISTSYNIDSMVTDKVYLDAVKYATKSGLLVFNSAGNNGQLNPPRQVVKELILVCSVQSKNAASQDIRSKFSNYGTGVDICAPGDPILSTVRGRAPNGASRYGELSGTSMATPAAAAVAALIWSHNPNFTADEVKAKLFESADKIEAKNPKYIGLLGAGRINALKALQ